MKKILFYCFANQQVGLGHLGRCLNLALKLRQSGAEVHFSGEFFDIAREILTYSKIYYEEIPWSQLPAVLIDFDVLVTDHYEISHEFSAMVTPLNKYWVAFSDFADFDYSGCDLVVNFLIEAEQRFSYQSKFQALGLEYFLAEPMWEKLRVENINSVIGEKLQKIFVCFGGTELALKGDSLVRKMARYYSDSEITYLSPSQEFFPENVTLKPLRRDIYSLINKSDLVVCAGGRMKYEACYSGFPTASFSLNQGQYEDNLFFEKNAMIIHLNQDCDHEEMDSDMLASMARKETRGKLARECLQKFSKNSENRIIEYILQ